VIPGIKPHVLACDASAITCFTWSWYTTSKKHGARQAAYCAVTLTHTYSPAVVVDTEPVAGRLASWVLPLQPLTQHRDLPGELACEQVRKSVIFNVAPGYRYCGEQFRLLLLLGRA
jgi:hypothetical protein